MKEIKRLSEEPTRSKTESTTNRSAKPSKVKACPEIDELEKELRAIKRSKSKKGVRKLYSHEGMFENSIQNENIESTEMRTKKDNIQNDQQLGKKMPLRLVKNPNFSYTLM